MATHLVGPPVIIGEPQPSVERSQISKTGPFSILIGLCSRACLSPGLADQGSDTQDSTWILVQHFVTSTSTQNPPAWPRLLPCLTTLSCHSRRTTLTLWHATLAGPWYNLHFLQAILRRSATQHWRYSHAERDSQYTPSPTIDYRAMPRNN